ncbi:MAG: hypothetical protein JW902_01340 [Syntrophaceae bacterium]|nr:hypothetical protein [Syntrophaceae bacterium]
MIRKRSDPDHENDVEKQLNRDIDTDTSRVIRIKKVNNIRIIHALSLAYTRIRVHWPVMSTV